MAGKKTITNLSELTSAASNDVLPVVDVSDQSVTSSGETKKITVTNLLSGKADSSHTHAISDVTNLQTSLDTKQDTVTAGDGLSFSGDTLNAEVTQAELDAKQDTVTAGDGLSFAGSTLNAEVTQAELDAKAASSHTHTLSDITDSGTAAPLNVASSGDAANGEVVKGDDSRLTDARTPSSHTHAISEVTNLQTSLDAKQATVTAGDGLSFSGSTLNAEVTQAELDAKAASSHTHTASEITDFDTEVANNSAVTANTAKVTNATHTGDATGSGALTVVALQGRSVSSSAPSDGQVLKWNNSASEWQAMADNNSGGEGGGGTPAGSTGQIQFNSGGSFGADSNLVWDDSNNRLGIGTASPSSKLDVDGKAIIRDDLDLYSDYCIQYWNKANGTDRLGWILNRDDNSCQYMWADGQPLMFGTVTTGGSTTERMRIDSSGTLTSTSTSTDAAFLKSSHANNTNVYINNTNATTGNTANLYFGPANNVSGAKISAIATEDFSTSANRSADLALSTRNNGNWVEAMRIDSGGLVGIGTTGPTEKLHIAGAGTQRLLVEETGSTVKTKLLSSTTAGVLATATDHPLGFDTNDQRRMTLTSTGLGIGPTSPSANLHISGANPKLRLQDSDETNVYTDIFNQSGDTFFRSRDGSSNGIFTFNGNNGTSDTEFLRIGSDGVVDLKGGRLVIGEADVASGHIDSFENLTFNIDTDNDDTNRYFSFTYNASAGAGTEVLRIDETGRVTVGNGSTITASGDADDLVIDKGAADTGLSILSTTTGRIYFGDAANEDAGSIRYVHSDDSMRFETDDTERMRIDSSGNVGIGTQNPAEALTIKSDGARIEVASDDYTNVIVGRRGQSGADLDKGIIAIKDTGTTKIQLDAAGNTYLNGGNVGIGTSAPSSPNSVSKCLHIHDSDHCSLVMSDDSNTWEIVSNLALTFRDGTDTRMTIESDGTVHLPSSSTETLLKIDGNSATTKGIRIKSENAGGIIYAANSSIAALRFGVTADDSSITEAARFDSQGRLGIGTTVPTRTLTVDSGATDTVALFRSSGDANAYILLEDANTTTGPHIGAVTDDLVLRTSDTERIRVASNGKIDISGYGTEGAYLTSKGSFRIDIDNDQDHSDRGFIISSNGGTDLVTVTEAGRVTVKKSSNAEVTALTDGATITPDLNDANNFSVTLGGNRTLANPSNCTAGQSGIITITQDGTGSRTLAYGSYWKFSGGTAPTLTTTASAVDVLAYYVESATRITATLITDTK